MQRLCILIICLLLAGCAARAGESVGNASAAEYGVSEIPDAEPVMAAPNSAADGEFTPDIPTFTAEKLPEEIKKAMEGVSHTAQSPLDWDDLRYLTIAYIDFKGIIQTGNMVVHRELAEEVLEIFSELYAANFPIERMELIEAYDGDDNRSMEANNTYAYCTRPIAGTTYFSNHSFGTAIDINPAQNPYMLGASALPAQSSVFLDRTDVQPGMIVEGGVCYNAFVSRGWTWGGHWPNPDYQHFEKSLA